MSSFKNSFFNTASFKEIFSIDLRSLAVMRICLALLILIDLILRSGDISSFYTDQGVLPRKDWLELTYHWYFSLHAASGEIWWQVVLFLVAGFFALMLLVGYRTKLASFMSWLLLASLLNRNIFIIQAGDILLLVMAFWSIFLPIGARWSIDAALRPELKKQPNLLIYDNKNSQQYFSVATIAVIFQVLALYFFTALLKDGPAWRYPFEAAHYAVSLQHFATPIGFWFSEFKSILPFATFYVLLVEFVAPILVLLPFAWPYLRFGGLILLASLHVGFMLLLHIGLFPLIDFMSLSLLIPSAFWIWLASLRNNDKRECIVIYYDIDCGFCLKMCLILREFLLPDSVKIIPAQTDDKIYAIMERENSWVITDYKNRQYTHWYAMSFLFSQSWLFSPLAWIMKIPPFMYLGNRLYHWVANNRGLMGELTAKFLPFRTLSLKPTMIGQIIATCFFIVIILYNISSLDGFQSWRIKPLMFLSHITRIDQKWDMFAPDPLKVSMFPQIVGKLRTRDKINLYPLTDPDPDWVAPDYMYPLYKNNRWRKYIGRLQEGSSQVILSAFGRYQCNKWNNSVKYRGQQLVTLEFYIVHLVSNINNKPKKRNRYLKWQHWCYPEFKPRPNPPISTKKI